jgi:Uma2 family endonuclease
MASVPIGLDQVPEDLYLESSAYDYSEYFDGAVIEKALPHKKHGRLVGWLCPLIEQSEYGGAVEVRSKLGARHYRLPDLAVAPKADWKTGPAYPEKPYVLCIEILSQAKDLQSTIDKCRLCHAWGVPHCWILDPETETGWQCDVESTPVNVAELSGGSLRLSVKQIFSVFHE